MSNPNEGDNIMATWLKLIGSARSPVTEWEREYVRFARQISLAFGRGIISFFRAGRVAGSSKSGPRYVYETTGRQAQGHRGKRRKDFPNLSVSLLSWLRFQRPLTPLPAQSCGPAIRRPPGAKVPPRNGILGWLAPSSSACRGASDVFFQSKQSFNL
jgi:hypothetical protein